MAAIDFPNSPSNNDVFSSQGKSWKYDGVKGVWKTVSTTTTANLSALGESVVPSANVTYDLGSSTNAFRDLYLAGSTLYLGNGQITSSANGAVTLPSGSKVGSTELGTGGATVYANASVLPTSGLTSGDLAYTGNAIFITNGSGWYRVAVTNQDPSLSITQDSLSFSGNTGAVLDFNYTVSDPDGTIPTITLSNSGFANTSVATIEHFTGNNTVRITNYSNTTYTGSITLTASDGISTGFDSANAIFTATVTITLSPYWDETVLSIGTANTNSLDNSTFIDRSGNNGTAEYSSNGTKHVQNAEHPYLDNFSVDFRKSTHNCALMLDTGSGGVNTGSGDFTIEGWYYLYDLSQSYSQLFYGGGGQFLVTSSGTLYKWSGYSHQTTLEAGRWYHIAFMRSSGSIKWYVDGVAASTSLTDSSDYNIDSVSRDHASESWNGLVSNFRMSNVARYSASGFTPPTEAFTSDSDTLLLTCNSNRYVDESSNQVPITLTSNKPQVSAFNPLGQGSEYSANNNLGSVNFDVDSALALNVAGSSLGQTWTVEMWYKHTTGTTVDTNHYLFDARSGSGAWYMYRNAQVYATPQSGVDPAMSDSNFNNGEWHWVTIVSDGTNMAYWLDGTRLATGTSSSSTTIGTNLWINGRFQGNYQNDCKIADLRVSSTARYATTSTSITVPTAAVGYDGNTSAYYPFDNAGIFDKTGNHALELAGNSVTSNTKTKYATTSMRFASASDYLITSGLEMGGFDDVTIEGWFNFDFTNSNVYIAGHDTTYAGNNNMYQLGLSSGRVGWWIGGSLPSTQYDPNTLNTNTWYHLAWVKDGSSYKIYKDGTQVASFTNTAAIQSHEWRVGNTYDGATQGFTGYMENFQIVKYAKYTANFTPPTAEQGRTYQATS